MKKLLKTILLTQAVVAVSFASDTVKLNINNSLDKDLKLRVSCVGQCSNTLFADSESKYIKEINVPAESSEGVELRVNPIKGEITGGNERAKLSELQGAIKVEEIVAEGDVGVAIGSVADIPVSITNDSIELKDSVDVPAEPGFIQVNQNSIATTAGSYERKEQPDTSSTTIKLDDGRTITGNCPSIADMNDIAYNGNEVNIKSREYTPEQQEICSAEKKIETQMKGGASTPTAEEAASSTEASTPATEETASLSEEAPVPTPEEAAPADQQN